MKKLESDLVETDCLLQNLKNGIEMVVTSEEKGVGIQSLVVRSVAEILSHGLRNPDFSFWHVVRDLTHSSERRAIARALKHVFENRTRGVFWVYYTLVERSLDSYMHSLVSDKDILRKNYDEGSLLRDNFCSTKFILLLTSLSQFVITPLDSTTCVGLKLEIKSVSSSFSSLISSPGDSGLHMETSCESVFGIDSATPAENVKRRKRVSFHETVVGEGPKNTVWERRSCDVETMSWWKSGLVGEKALDALDMERGAPEGSEDPQTFVETKEKKKAVTKRPKKSHLMKLYPGPMKPEPVIEFDDSELDFAHKKIQKCTIPGLDRFLNSIIYKMYNLIDTDGKSYLCFLAEKELCFLTLSSVRTVNMHRIDYRDLKYICVGPSPEHITLQDGRKFLLTTRGQDFCSWLHYASAKESKKPLDFIKIGPEDFFASAVSRMEAKADDLIYSTWAVVCDPFASNDLTYREHLMFSFGANTGYWEPAFVEINQKCELEVKPSLKNCRTLRLPLSECSFCDRYLSSGRPYTFKLRFDRKNDSFILYLATPDSRSMSNWMQAILLAVASKKNKNRRSVAEDYEGHHLVGTDGMLFLINSTLEKINKAYLRDVTGVYSTQGCITLEFGCCEIEERGNDWSLYFYSDEVKMSFLDFLTTIQPELLKVTYDFEEVGYSRTKCDEIKDTLDKDFKSILDYLTSL